MRQRCELCRALGAGSSRAQQLIGVAVGSRDALLCAEHALFALDADVASLAELRELHEFVAAHAQPAAEEAAVAVRRGGTRQGSRVARGAL